MNKLSNDLARYGDVLENVALCECTTLKIGGIAHYVVFPKNILSLSQLMEYIQENNLEFKLFGKGSNLICSDDEYSGIIIRLDRYFNDFFFEENECVAQAGCSIITIAYEAMKKGLSGLEFACGIPGTVGGVTFMNAGAYKTNMADIIEEVFIYRDNQCCWISNTECEFAYRHSIFSKHPDWIVIALKLKLKPVPQEEIRLLMEERRQRRIASQPLDYPNAGSVFRNPPGDFAWKYIEELGYRGKSMGGAKVSDKHVNFIVNENEATAKDFMNLVQCIQNDVKRVYDVDLVMEVEKFNWQKR